MMLLFMVSFKYKIFAYGKNFIQVDSPLLASEESPPKGGQKMESLKTVGFQIDKIPRSLLRGILLAASFFTAIIGFPFIAGDTKFKGG